LPPPLSSRRHSPKAELTSGARQTENTAAQDEGHNLPNDFRLVNTKADGRDGDHTEPNVLPGDMASTAGRGGDTRHVEPAEHEVRCVAFAMRTPTGRSLQCMLWAGQTLT